MGSKPKLRTTPKTPMIDEGARAASDLSRHSGSSAAAHLVRARVRVRVSVKVGVRVRVGVSVRVRVRVRVRVKVRVRVRVRLRGLHLGQRGWLELVQVAVAVADIEDRRVGRPAHAADRRGRRVRHEADRLVAAARGV